MSEMHIKFIGCIILGGIIGYGVKVESRTKTIIKEIQPACVHKYKAISCVGSVSGTSRSSNIIQECEKCGSIRRERVYI